MVRAGVFAAVGGLAAAAVLAAAPTASADTVAFGPNSPLEPFHSWTVPAKVCSASFDLYGAEGSHGAGGARVTTTLAVAPGTLYYIFVGGWGYLGRGGYNGGGGATGNGGGGGGATDVRSGPSLAERILVAGGGGGNGGASPSNGTAGGAGGGGGMLGADGMKPLTGAFPGLGGGGGTASSGGALGEGGSSSAPGFDGAAGTLGQGGQGGIVPMGYSNSGYGGGGGGLYGGGGGGAGAAGGAGGGGGGGSSLAAGGTVTPTTGGQGKAIITYFTSASCSQPGGGGGGGGQTGGGADRTKPTLSRLSFAHHSFAAAKSGAAISANTKATPKLGTKISFNLSEPSSVKFTVQRKVNGRKLRGRCVNPGQSPHGKRCTRWTAVKGSFSFVATADKNTLIFRGRVGGKTLTPGDYRLNSKATDNAHNASPLKRKSFKIVT